MPKTSLVQTPLATCSISDVQENYDAIIVGAGHNGLVCANYLAKAGQKVLVAERLGRVGGAAASEQLRPGYWFSRYSYVFSIFRQAIVDEIFPKNWRKELVIFPNEPALLVPTENADDYFLNQRDDTKTHASLTRFAGKQDADNYFIFKKRLEEIGQLIFPVLDTAPADSLFDSIRLGLKMRRPKLQSVSEIMQFLLAPASVTLNRWFTSDRLKAALAYSGLVGHMYSPYSVGSSMLLLYHVSNTLAMENDTHEYRFYPQGGMGAVSHYLARLAIDRGVDIVLNAPVNKILLESNRAVGIECDKTTICGKKIISNATYEVTYRTLLADEKNKLPEPFDKGLDSIDYSTNCCKLNMIVKDVPQFKCLQSHFQNLTSFAEKKSMAARYMSHVLLAGNSLQDLDTKYKDALQGRINAQPTIQIIIPSLMDDSLTPQGSEDLVLLMFVQYTPYQIEGGWSKDNRQKLIDNVLSVMDNHAPGFSDSVTFIDDVLPPDIEKNLNMTGGNIFQGALNVHSQYNTRPMPQYANYEGAFENLFSCSAANHPGGGVSGAPGRNCALKILRR